MHVEQNSQQHQVYQHHPKPVVKIEAPQQNAAVLVEAVEQVPVEQSLPEVIPVQVSIENQPVVLKINRNRGARNQ